MTTIQRPGSDVFRFVQRGVVPTRPRFGGNGPAEEPGDRFVSSNFKRPPREIRNEVQKSLKEVDQARREGQYEKALRICESLYPVVREHMPKAENDVVLEHLRVSRAMGDVPKSAQLLERLKALGVDNRRANDLSLEIGQALGEKRFAQAEQACEAYLALPNSEAELISNYGHYAQACLAQGKWKKAEAILRARLAALKESVDEKTTGPAREFLGVLEQPHQEPRALWLNLLQHIQVFELNPLHPTSDEAYKNQDEMGWLNVEDLAGTLGLLSTALEQQGRFQEAEHALQIKFSLYNAQFGLMDSRNRALNTLEDLAVLYGSQIERGWEEQFFLEKTYTLRFQIKSPFALNNFRPERYKRLAVLQELSGKPEAAKETYNLLKDYYLDALVKSRYLPVIGELGDVADGLSRLAENPTDRRMLAELAQDYRRAGTIYEAHVAEREAQGYAPSMDAYEVPIGEEGLQRLQQMIQGWSNPERERPAYLKEVDAAGVALFREAEHAMRDLMGKGRPLSLPKPMISDRAPYNGVVPILLLTSEPRARD